MLINAAQEYAKIGALETTIASGALTGTALANAKDILASLKTGAARYGITPATCANALATWALAGVVIEIVDWGSFWQMLFENEAYKEGYVYTNNPLSNIVVNNTNADDWAKKFIDWTGVSGDAWDWDYVEMTDKGWLAIYDWANSIFGEKETEETQTMPEMSPIESIQSLNLQYAGEQTINYFGMGNQTADVYYVTDNVYFVDSIGQWFKSSNGLIDKHVYFQDKWWDTAHNDTGYWSITLHVFKTVKSYKYYPYVTEIMFEFVRDWDWRNVGQIPLVFDNSDLGFPEIPYRSGYTVSRKIPDLLGGASRSWELDPETEPEPQPQPEPEDEPKKLKKPVRIPTVPNSDTKTPEQNLEEFMKELAKDPNVVTRQIVDMFPDNPTEPEPQPEPSPSPSPTPKPDTETPTEPDDPTEPKPDNPDDPTKKKFDFSPLMNITGLAEVFPFCLPFDYIRLLKTFNAPRTNPIFNISMPLVKGHTFDMTLDFTLLEPIMAIVRGLFQIGFAVALMFITYKFIKW